MQVRIEPLDRVALPQAQALLRVACAYDRAADVAEEKLLGAAPQAPAQALAATRDGELLGVASTCAHAVQLLAVAPAARGRGVGSRLLDAALASIAATGAPRARVLGLAGNYLAPGVDARAVDTLAWLARRGFAPRGEPVTNLLLDVRDNPRVSAATADAAAARVRAAGYVVRRAHRDEPALLAAIAAEFGGAWPFEVGRALVAAPGAPGVHVALAPDGSYAGFAAHDGNNAGLGWFGPAGTWPAHRGCGLGEALLLACLVDVAAHHPRCEVAWIGPRGFYDRVAGIADERQFVMLTKALP
jgi:mycothiol synthase